jgi:urocanate hydratase
MELNKDEVIAALARVLPAGLTVLPPPRERSTSVPHAPNRKHGLTRAEFVQAVKNVLRYFPAEWHAELGPEFGRELQQYGHIYAYRFMPSAFSMRAYPVSWYPGRHAHARAAMLMIMNNLDPAVAQYPEELVTYGGNGSVFSSWAEFALTMSYLCRLDEHSTLVLNSGHPQGLFPSLPSAPRLVITNGMMVPMASTPAEYDRLYALGVTQYGQMTAGGFAYIGPQGIVHGTVLTILNAGRRYLGGGHADTSLAGKVYLSSGLGGMSGAQGKAGVICGAVTVIAEVDEAALDKRHAQGWVTEKVTSLDELVARVRAARAAKEPAAIAYLGNIVDVWERFAAEAESTGDNLIDLASDQTSLHNPFQGGYYPADYTFAEASALMVADPPAFKLAVQASLRRHVAGVNALVARGTRFWDYGNSFLLEAFRAGADIALPPATGASGSAAAAAAAGAPGATVSETSVRFRYPSYVEEFMGDIFSMGFGPFRWVCASGSTADLARTDAIAGAVIERLMSGEDDEDVKGQLGDNLLWIRKAEENKMVVGSQARILYADAAGRAAIAAAMNAAVAAGELEGPVVLSRDHHDVSGTDSPFRETSNVEDGSKFTADMAVQNCIGDAVRGATWVALHNGGGTGWGKAINGGFGLVLDGSDDAAAKARLMLFWDVNNGVARRAWAGNAKADRAIRRAQAAAAAGVEGALAVTPTLPVHAAAEDVERLVAESLALAYPEGN